MIASELTNPSIVKVSRSNSNYFWYGKEKFQFTGRFSINDAEIRHIESGVEIVWNLSEKQPTLEEIVKQFETWYEIWKGGVQRAIEAANES